MREDIRRVTGTILRAPFTRRTVRELLYCGIGGTAGLIGFLVILVVLIFGLTISVSVLGTVIGLLLLTLATRLGRRLGGLHRRLAGWLLDFRVGTPPRFSPGSGILGRLDQRLRDRTALAGHRLQPGQAARRGGAVLRRVRGGGRPDRRHLPGRLAAVPPPPGGYARWAR